VLISTTVNANHISADMHFQPQGISGVGSVSGDKYQGTGITRFSFQADVVSFPFIETIVNNFKIIGQGPGNNFLVHENFHLDYAHNEGPERWSTRLMPLWLNKLLRSVLVHRPPQSPIPGNPRSKVFGSHALARRA
jgi:hypothetical protein